MCDSLVALLVDEAEEVPEFVEDAVEVGGLCPGVEALADAEGDVEGEALTQSLPVPLRRTHRTRTAPQGRQVTGELGVGPLAH